jgi:hypothetical protein
MKSTLSSEKVNVSTIAEMDTTSIKPTKSRTVTNVQMDVKSVTTAKLVKNVSLAI